MQGVSSVFVLIGILFFVNTIAFFSLKDELTFKSFFYLYFKRSDDKIENIKLYVFQVSYVFLIAVLSASTLFQESG